MKSVEATAETQISYTIPVEEGELSREWCVLFKTLGLLIHIARPLLAMCSGFDSSTRVHCVLPLKHITGKPRTNPSMWPSLCKFSTCISDRDYYSASFMTGKVENVQGGGEGVMKLEKFLLPYSPFGRTCVGLRGATFAFHWFLISSEPRGFRMDRWSSSVNSHFPTRPTFWMSNLRRCYCIDGLVICGQKITQSMLNLISKG